MLKSLLPDLPHGRAVHARRFEEYQDKFRMPGRNVTTSRNSPVAGRGLIIIIGILPGGIDYAWMAFLRLLAHAIISYLAL